MALVPGARERACAALAGRVLVPEHEAEATVAAAGIDLTLLLSGRAFVRAASKSELRVFYKHSLDGCCQNSRRVSIMVGHQWALLQVHDYDLRARSCICFPLP